MKWKPTSQITWKRTCSRYALWLWDCNKNIFGNSVVVIIRFIEESHLFDCRFIIFFLAECRLLLIEQNRHENSKVWQMNCCAVTEDKIYTGTPRDIWSNTNGNELI